MLPSISRVMRSRRLSRNLLAVTAVAALAAIGGTSSGVAQQGAPAEPETDGAPPVMRVLTQEQYRQSIADIFGSDIKVAGRFDRGQRPAEGRLLAIGTSSAGISAAGFEQFESMGRSIAGQVVDAKHRETLLPCKPADEKAFDSGCATQIVNRYGPLLYRRALAPAEVTSLVSKARASQARLGDFYSGMATTLSVMLVQPDFLFRIEKVEADPAGGVRMDGYSKASRLSYFLVNSTPDAELLRAAGAGELHTQSGLARQVDRLLASPQLEKGMRAYLWDLLGFEHFDDIQKDPQIFPTYSTRIATDAQEQTLRTMVDHLLVQKADYRDVFTTRKTFLTRSLGSIYAVPVSTKKGWEAAEYPADSNRGGVLTDISFLALWSHPGRSSPTIRGKMLAEIFLCRTVPAPPGDVDFAVANDISNPNLKTARQRLDAHVTAAPCKGCHLQMDPMGFTLEKFDSVGAYRTTENGAVIDTSGSLGRRTFSDVEGLGQAMRDSPVVPACFADNLYRYGVGRNYTKGETAWRDYLRTSFEASGYKAPQLLRTIALSDAFYAVARPAAAPLQTAAISPTKLSLKD